MPYIDVCFIGNFLLGHPFNLPHTLQKICFAIINATNNAKLYLKRLYGYLAAIGLSGSAYEELLSFRVIRGSRVFPAASPSDVATILNQIDRRIPAGKRDYAIILLGAVIGLYAIDI